MDDLNQRSTDTEVCSLCMGRREARMGGESFLLLLPMADLSEASELGCHHRLALGGRLDMGSRWRLCRPGKEKERITKKR